MALIILWSAWTERVATFSAPVLLLKLVRLAWLRERAMQGQQAWWIWPPPLAWQTSQLCPQFS